MKICIAGKNDIAVNALTYISQNYPQFEIWVICNRSDNGKNSWQKSLKNTALKHNIPIKELEDIYEIPDLLFLSLEYDKIINPSLFSSSRLYNIHFSLLPAYKGMYTSIMPILNNEKISGVTLHKIDAGIDTGDVLDQISFTISESDNGRNLYDKYLLNAFLLFQKNIDSLLLGEIKAGPQSSKGASYYSKKTIDFKNIIIDTKKTAEEIFNQIRAFAFRDYQLPQIGNYKIWRSEISSIPSQKHQVGKYEQKEAHYIEIHAIDYIVYAYIDFEEELFDAAANGDIEYIKWLQSINYDIHIQNEHGWDILIVSTYNNQQELVKYLLDINFDIAKTNYKGTSVLMYAMTIASKLDELSMLNLILSYMPNLYHVDDLGLSVFDYAMKYGNEQVINRIKKEYDKVS